MLDSLKELLAKLTWTITIIIVVGGAAYFWFTVDETPITNKQNEIQSTHDRIELAKKKIVEAEEFERNFELRKQEYQKLVKTLQATQASLPKEFYLPDLLSDILQEAKKLGLEIVSFHPENGNKEEAKEFYSKITFQMQIKGSFLQVFLYLDRMAHIKRLVDITKLDLRKDVGKDSKDEVRVGVVDGELSNQLSSTQDGKAYSAVSADLQLVAYRYTGNSTAPAGGAK